MLSVANETFRLNVIKLSVIMLGVSNKLFMLKVIMMSVIMLSVVAVADNRLIRHHHKRSG
jgi:hypothetical protein